MFDLCLNSYDSHRRRPHRENVNTLLEVSKVVDCLSVKGNDPKYECCKF